MADPTKIRMKTTYRVGGLLGFFGGFLLAYQRSSCKSNFGPFLDFVIDQYLVRFWGWTENKREEDMDLAELRQLAKEGKPLYGESHQPSWVQHAAFTNSQFSQLKFCEDLRGSFS